MLEMTEITPSPRLLTARIRERAFELGFHKVGIVPAAALAEERTRLEEWLRRGYHGEMRWMERDPAQRTDPRLVFPAEIEPEASLDCLEPPDPLATLATDRRPLDRIGLARAPASLVIPRQRDPRSTCRLPCRG